MAPIVRFAALLAGVRALLSEWGRVGLVGAVVGRRPGPHVAGHDLGAPRVRVAALGTFI